MVTGKKSILFACTGNTCRSVFAEWLGRSRFGAKASFASAGIKPQNAIDASNAIQTLREQFKLDASSHVPRGINSLDLSQFTYVVAMDPRVAKYLTNVPKEKLIVWKIDDPYGNDLEEYRKCALMINQQLEKLNL